MSKRRILFKGVALVALVLNLVPVPVMASPPFEARFTAAASHSVAEACKGFTDECVQLPWPGPRTTRPATMLPAGTSTLRRSADAQLAPAFPAAVGVSVDDVAGVASAMLEPMQQHALTVTKTVEWSGIAPDAGQQFTICVEGPTYPISDCQAVDYTGGAPWWRDLASGVYTVTETYPGDEWDVTVVGSPVTFLEDGDATAAVTNTRRLGSLAVTKAVEWNGIAPDAGQQFTICVEGPSHPISNCHTFGHTGGTLPWDDLIPGDYTVIEVDPGDEWNVAIAGSPATVPEDGGGASATVTNTRKLGSLAVTKAVEWSGIAPDVGQQFTICVEGPSRLISDCRTVGHMGGILPWSGLIPGEYTVTEDSPGSAWNVAIDGSPATVPEDGGGASATVTNARRLGSLAVTKVVEWNGVTPDIGQRFVMCIQGPSHPDVNCRWVGYSGGTRTWRDLIPGEYNVAEFSPGDEWDIVTSGSPATVPEDGGGASAAITNSRKLGSLVVTKAVDWNGVPPDRRQTFVICVEGPKYPAGDCKVVGHIGGPLSWHDLIPGDYTVTEFSPGDEWDVTIVGSPAAVPDDGGSVGAGIINTRRLGSLTVTKVVNWNDVIPDPGQTFTICVEGPSHPTDYCKAVGYDGGDLRWEQLVPGNYVVTEVEPGGAWFGEVTGSPATVPADGGSASATVMNEYQLGWLRVTKTVDWGLARPDASRQFTICISGPSYLAVDCRTVGHAGGPLSWDDLIPGDYVVTERDPGDGWEVEVEGSPATVPDDGTGISASISNYYGGSTVYLPLVTRSFVASAPDLVVEDVLVTSDSVRVVIKNQGDGPVLSTNAFWVDLYVDPDPVPTAVDQTWDSLCDQGIVWGVTAPALALEPGGTLTLTIGDDYYWENYSYFPGALPPGTPIYVQVDSADVQTTYGAVLERHEITGDPYNNIAGPVPSTGGVASKAQVAGPAAAASDRPWYGDGGLPSRP